LSQRVLFIARELTEGGAAFLAIRHLKRLIRADRQIDFLITGPISNALSAELDGVAIHKPGVDINTSLTNPLELRRACIRAYPCLTNDYDIVVGTSLFPDMVACVTFSASRGHRKLLVLLDEGLILPDLKADMKAAMQCAIVATDHLVPVSLGLFDKLSEYYSILKEIPRTIIFPPIEPQYPAGASPFTRYLADQLPHVVTAARLDQIKQIPTCLRTHWQLRREGIDFHWHVLGDGSERFVLEQEIAQLGMADRFHLEGFQIEPRAWMKYADLFVLISRSEGCPTVIREALAEGTPVLATDVNGVRELIDDGVTGSILADCEVDLKDNLRRLMTDRSACQRLRVNIARLPRELAGNETIKLSELFSGNRRPRSRPNVTILIPTYNHAKRIQQAIESALMQDYPSLEIVICDDASTDNTAIVATRYLHDPRLKYVRRPLNIGRVANYHQALKVDARGDWILVLDGDDYLIDPMFISKAMYVLELNKVAQPLFLQAGHRVIWETTRKKSDSSLANAAHVDILPSIETETALLTGAQYLSLVFKTGFFTHLGTLYSRTAALEQGFYTQNISSADMDSLLRLAIKGNVIVMSSIAGVWVQHENNASANVHRDRIKENVQIFRQISKEGVQLGTIDIQKLEKELTGFEARCLKHLFSTTIGKSSIGPIAALKMLLIMAQVNPRVYLDRELMQAWRGWAKQLTYKSARHLMSKLKRTITKLFLRS
tara:strand:- start:514 stop:2670 length:2157 start_codon:yes stop_codon:yes gene_type:complete